MNDYIELVRIGQRLCRTATIEKSPARAVRSPFNAPSAGMQRWFRGESIAEELVAEIVASSHAAGHCNICGDGL